MRPTRELRWHAAAALLIGASGLLCYWRSLAAPFTFDDYSNIVNNPSLRWVELGWQELRNSLVASPSPRPVSNWSFGLSHWLSGLDAPSYRAWNLALHLANGVLAYAIALQLFAWLAPATAPGRRAGAALFAALVFTLHPIQSQSVIYVVQRMNVLAVFFYFIGILGYFVARSASGGARWLAWAGVALAWGLGIASKQVAATLPFALWGIEWVFHRERSWTWARRHAAWLVLPVGAMLALALFYLGGDLTYGYENRSFGMWQRVLTQTRVLVMYLGLVLWPMAGRFNVLHDLELSHSLFDPIATLWCAALLVAFLVLALRLPARHRLYTFAILWFFLHVAIESSVLSLMLAFEHRMLLPMFGIALALGWALATLGRLSDTARVAIGLALVAVLGLNTALRAEVWRDNETLWADAVAKSPRSARALTNLGVVYSERRRYAEAKPLLERAVALDERYDDAHWNLGAALLALGDYDAALRHYERATQLADDPMAWGGYASLLLRRGAPNEAIAAAEKAVRLSPQPRILHILARAYASAGRWDDAVEQYRWSLAMAPGFAPAESGLGLAYAARGEFAQAERAFRSSLSHGVSAEAQAGLAESLWLRGAQAEALQAQVGAYAMREPGAGERLGEWLTRTQGDALVPAREALVYARAEAEARGDRALAQQLEARLGAASPEPKP